MFNNRTQQNNSKTNLFATQRRPRLQSRPQPRRLLVARSRASPQQCASATNIAILWDHGRRGRLLNLVAPAKPQQQCTLPCKWTNQTYAVNVAQVVPAVA